MNSTNGDKLANPVSLTTLKPKITVSIDPNLKPAIKQVSGIAMDAQGNVFIADTYQHRIIKLSPSGDLVWVIGEKGKGDGLFNYPRGLAISQSQERLLVCDSWNHRVVAINLDGAFDFSFGKVGSGAGQFYDPYDICATAADELIVVDRGNHRLQRFSVDGKFKGMAGRRGSVVEQEMASLYNTPGKMFSTPCFLFPSGISSLSSDSVAVLDSSNRRVMLFTDQLQLVSEYDFTGVAGNGRFMPTAIAANDVGFLFLFDYEQGLIEQIAPPGFPISTLRIEAAQKGDELQPRLLATAGGLIMVNTTSRELEFFELEQSSLKESLMNATHDSDERAEEANEAQVAWGIKWQDRDLINKGISGAASRESASFNSLRAAARGLIELDLPLNLYLLLSRTLQVASIEREQTEKEQIELLRELEPMISQSASETAACEAALIADDSSPHSVSEADIFQDYQETLLRLKRLMAKNQRQTIKQVKLVRDAALLFRRRRLNEAYDFCLAVLLQVAFKEAASLKDSLLSIRNRLGEMVGLARDVMSDSPEQQMLNRFIYLGRYRTVLDANRGLHLGTLTEVTASVAVVLCEQANSSKGPKVIERTDSEELEFASSLLESIVTVFVVGSTNSEILNVSGQLIWALLRSCPSLRENVVGKDAFEALGYDLEHASIDSQELERFVYLYVFSRAVNGKRLLGASILDEAASVALGDAKLPDVMETIWDGTEERRTPEDFPNDVLESIKQVRDSIVTHGQSWARVLLESYMRLGSLRASPRALANKALMDTLATRQRDCYGAVCGAHRMSLEGSSQLLRLLVAGVTASRNEKLISQVGKELSTTRLVEILKKLALNVCPPLADESGKPVCDEDSLSNLMLRDEVLHVVLNALSRVRMFFADGRFHLSLSGVKFGLQLAGDGTKSFNRETVDFLIASSENYIRCQRGLREWLWSHWGEQSLGSDENVLDPKLLGNMVATRVLSADRSMRTKHLLEALDWAKAELAQRRGRRIGRTKDAVSSDGPNSERSVRKTRLPRELLRATFYLYCNPSTRSAAGDFWQSAHGESPKMKDTGGNIGLAAAAKSIASRDSSTATRTKTNARSDKTELLDAMIAWINKVCAYGVEFARYRASKRDESGRASKPMIFVDATKNMMADLRFSGCNEATLSTAYLAVSSGLDIASIAGWVPEPARAGLEKLMDDMASIDMPDNLCDWAQESFARSLSIYRTFFDQLSVVNDVISRPAPDGEADGEELITLAVPEPDENDTLPKLLPRLMLDKYHFDLAIARATRIAESISLQKPGDDEERNLRIRWIETTSAAADKSLKAIERSRQACGLKLRGARTGVAEAVASQEWAPRVAELGWRNVAILLNQMTSAASNLHSRLEALRRKLVLAAWSPQANLKQREQFFEGIERSLRADPTQYDVRRKLGDIVLLDEADAQDVKRAVHLRARYTAQLVETIRNVAAHPYGIATDAAGGVLVTDFYKKNIVRYDRGTKLSEVVVRQDIPGRSGAFVGPYCLAPFNGGVLCSFAQGDLVVEYDHNFNEVGRLGPSIDDSALGTVLGLAADERHDRLYIADYDGSRVQTMAFHKETGKWQAVKSTTVESPCGIAVDSTGNIAVSSHTGNRVTLFDDNWRQTALIEGLASPHLLAFGPDSSLFVADTLSDSIRRFSPEGELIYAIPARRPLGVWIRDDELFATGIESGEIWVWLIKQMI
ncbi:NHL repeat-containing protein [bacterium]|nr:NHL repeat-containing protein [bacterium]